MVLRGVSLDPLALRSALALIPPSAWSLPSTYEATKVHHGYRRVVLADLAPFAFALDHFAPIHDAWLSWIDPGGFIVPHRDAAPWHERWQVPIATAGTFTMGTEFAPTDGQAFQVRHWEPHSVRNDTDRPRIHLVIDRAVLIDRPPLPFEVFTTSGDAHG